MGDLTKIIPPASLSDADRLTIFNHVFRRLAATRNTAELYAMAEGDVSGRSSPPESNSSGTMALFVLEVDLWVQSILSAAWIACREPGGGDCPTLDPLSDSSTGDLPTLPAAPLIEKTVNSILFLHITTTKSYSARSRAFLSQFGTLDERAISTTLKDPDAALKAASVQVDATKAQYAKHGRALRAVGMGVGAVAGGVLIGVTGGLAAPLVGAGVSAVFGALGLGGTAVGLLAGGLASSSVVCGALFGAYGARSTARMVERHTKEVRDLAVVPVRPPQETLALRLCVSGWLGTQDDVIAPWTVFEGDDTFALQWEVEALEALSSALSTLVKAQAMRYVKAQIIKHTFFASLMSSLAPLAWLQIGRIIDNPWTNTKALAIKTGAVLADLLVNRAFGERPITLTGYSLGALVIFTALSHLAELPPARTAHLVQDVFLFGAPVPSDPHAWAVVRRVVAGRLVNGYGAEDYVLAVLARASDASWGVAGLQAIEVMGVDNVEIVEVDGHLRWAGMVGKALVKCGAPGVRKGEAEKRAEDARREAEKETSRDEAESVLKEGPTGKPDEQ
ncbi:DUF726-domain-containing protein [Artomyces pyxidatus]|uniref:DUF726-domain-containing protein n=1 Tax=Artomyces pyxidatus TaxID=48021 RepID=A0ACB8T7P4_9AGAM|nr:DUF726-domain-containing protein [Artomyces pyxidatus]